MVACRIRNRLYRGKKKKKLFRSSDEGILPQLELLFSGYENPPLFARFLYILASVMHEARGLRFVSLLLALESYFSFGSDEFRDAVFAPVHIFKIPTIKRDS
jgi:hypothetical protein